MRIINEKNADVIIDGNMNNGIIWDGKDFDAFYALLENHFKGTTVKIVMKNFEIDRREIIRPTVKLMLDGNDYQTI